MSLDHDAACGCSLCRHVRAEAHEVLPIDRERLAVAWATWVSTADGEVAKLRAGENGNPGSPRWTALQAIAAARIAGAAAA